MQALPHHKLVIVYFTGHVCFRVRMGDGKQGAGGRRQGAGGRGQGAGGRGQGAGKKALPHPLSFLLTIIYPLIPIHFSPQPSLP